MNHYQGRDDAAYRQQQRDADERWEKEQREAEEVRQLKEKAQKGGLEWADLGYEYPEPESQR
jgi:type II secretory pathway component PulF